MKRLKGERNRTPTGSLQQALLDWRDINILFFIMTYVIQFQK